ncbi:SAM-dependent chlorinase/fluorinase [Saccharothrix sp. AJ9571]|nr:SAM-dependent chlorinase/fluorinase [Saccharothrix sp. AJ9571]
MMLDISPSSQIVDITHEVAPFDVQVGARYLKDLAEYFPADTVFCCIIYPETGTSPTIVVENERGQYLVGPDNGVYTHIMDRSGVRRVHEVRDERVQRNPPSPSFWGRDVVVACAAHLAAGFPIQEVGPERADVAKLTESVPEVQIGDGYLRAAIALVDVNFGNLWSDVTRGQLREAGLAGADRLEVRMDGHTHQWPLVSTFSEVGLGEPLAYFNSRDELSFALNQGNLAEHIGVRRGTEIELVDARVHE